MTNSTTVPDLQHGESADIEAAFGTSTPAGTLILVSNDQTGTVYVSSTLTRP